MSLPYVEPLGDGIHVIDTGFHRPRFDAAYLLVQDGRAAFVDTGTNFAVPRLLAALDDLGLAPDAVDHVIATHVHLDHAGGVGLLMKSLPRATVRVHPRGARHLVDPSALYQGALAVYGEQEMARSYGELHAISADRVQAMADQQELRVGTRVLCFMDSPGHARHHHCIWDEATGGWFTGDTFGLAYPELHSARGPWVAPSSTPVQFDPDALKQSIDRLMAKQPRCMYLTHFGRVDDVPRLAALLHHQIDQMVALGRSLQQAPDRHQALKQALARLYLDGLTAHGLADPQRALELLSLDIELNAQGLAIWLDR